jgi:hypothetical protein
VYAGYLGRAVQVGDGTGDLERAVVGAGRQIQPPDSHFEGTLSGIVQGTVFADSPRGRARVIEAPRLHQGVAPAESVFVGSDPSSMRAQDSDCQRSGEQENDRTRFGYGYGKRHKAVYTR